MSTPDDKPFAAGILGLQARVDVKAFVVACLIVYIAYRLLK